MALLPLDFPPAPNTGDKYPTPGVPGQPVYVWDGEKWTTQGGSISAKQPVYTDGSTAMTTALTLVTPPVLPNDAAAKGYVDTNDALSVKYNTAQSLTLPQQQQARTNIFAAAADAALDALAFNGMQINGSFEISQEKGSAATVANGGYVCDGWRLLLAGTMVPGASVLAGPWQTPYGSYGSFLNVSISTAEAALAAGDFLYVYQSIEGLRVQRLVWGTANAQPITIGFWSAHHRTGLYSVAVRNNANNRSYVATYTQAAPDSMQWNTVTIPGDTTGTWLVDNTIGMTVTFTLACGTTGIAPAANAWQAGNYIAAPGQVNAAGATTDVTRIAGVIVIPGTAAPSAVRAPFVMRPYDQELLLCQRYYRKQVSSLLADGYVSAGAAGYGDFSFPVSMRASPTITFANITYSNASTLGVNAPSSLDHVRFQFLASAAGAAYAIFDYICDARL